MIGKWLCIIGIGFIVVGLALWGLSKLGVAFGSLPGDLSYKTEKTAIYIPITTSIIVSITLSVVLSLWFWFSKK